MPCDSTTNIQEFFIKTKLSGAMSTSLLKNREFVFGDTEKSLFVKAASGSTLYQFGRISDTTSVSSNDVWSNYFTKNYIDNIVQVSILDDITGHLDSVWSSTFTKNYIDSFDHISIVDDISGHLDSVWSSSFTIDYIDSIMPVRSILLTAGGLFPDSSSGCSSPYITNTPDIPKVMVDFSGSGEKGFWNIAIPGDYSGNVDKITILYSGPASACTWTVRAKVLSDNDTIDTGGTWSTGYTLSDTPANADRLEKVETSGTINLFGSVSNKGNFTVIEIELTSGTGTFKLLQVKLEY